MSFRSTAVRRALLLGLKITTRDRWGSTVNCLKLNSIGSPEQAKLLRTQGPEFRGYRGYSPAFGPLRAWRFAGQRPRAAGAHRRGTAPAALQRGVLVPDCAEEETDADSASHVPDKHPVLLAQVAGGGGDDRLVADGDRLSVADGLPDVLLTDEVDDGLHLLGRRRFGR